MGGRLSAPGKAFLAGEYAVLEPGGVALVLAIDRALHLEWRELPAPRIELLHRPSGAALRGELRAGDICWSPSAPPELRFAARAAQLASRLCAEQGLAPRGFSAVFLNDLAGAAGAKLGFGGSAAASVLAVRATCAAHGSALSDSATLALAGASHWIEQGGEGSGADVAACALGGLVEARPRPRWARAEEPFGLPAAALVASPLVEARRVSVPPDLRVLLVFTGASADSRALVRRVRAFGAASPTRWRAHAEALSREAESLREALEEAARDAGPAPRTAALAAVHRAAAAMQALGAESGAPIYTPELARACALAESAGAAGKPSGAGGGDCAVVLAFGDAALRSAERALGSVFESFRVAPSP